MARTDQNTSGSHARAALATRDAARPPACPACGATARRESARFCATCGRSLRERDYRPADSLRASYRWQTTRDSLAPRRELLIPAERPRPRESARETRRTASRSLPTARSVGRRARAARNEETRQAYVLLAYALCFPLVGILLCPCAILCGAAGLRRARREHAPRAAREAERSVVYGILLFGAQALMWEVMFLIVPAW